MAQRSPPVVHDEHNEMPKPEVKNNQNKYYIFRGT